MTLRPLVYGLFLVCTFSAAGPATAAPAKCYDWILREKMRAGYLAAYEPRTAAAGMKAVGMNALLPKFGGLTCPPDETNLRLLGEWGEAARKAGMHVLPVFNFRGGETEKLLGARRREVTDAGLRMEKTPCPLDEEFWKTYVLRRAVDLASRAKELHLAGAILDPEMYGSDHTIYQRPCYCDDCLREFCQAAGQPLPASLPAAGRAEWLKEHNLGDHFQNYFIARIRGFCEHVERAVHDRNPDFLLGVFMLDYPLPFMRGMAEGLGSEQHPVLGFSESTYSIGYTEYVEKQQRTFAAFPSHVLFVPGLWLTQFPTENLAEQFYTCAQRSAGYWIYTFESLVEDVSKMPGYALHEPHDRYWAAMQAANSELDRLVASGGKYESALKVRPFDPPFPRLPPVPESTFGNGKLEALAPVGQQKPLSLGPETFPRLRYYNPLYILARAGEPVELRVNNQPLNPDYRFGTQYAVCDAEGNRILEGVMKVGESAVAKWTPARDGVYVALVHSDQNGYSLRVPTGQPFAFKAAPGRPFTVNGYLGRLYFYVPRGVAKLTVFAKAEGHVFGQGDKLTVFAPDGKVAARIAGNLDPLPVSVPESMQDRVWALTAEDLTNDLVIHLSPDAVSYLSTDPSRLLRPK